MLKIPSKNEVTAIITFFALATTLSLSLGLFTTTNLFKSVFAQAEAASTPTNSIFQNNFNNNTVTYSYSIHDSNKYTNTHQPNLYNSSVTYYNNTTGYLVYPNLTSSMMNKGLPAVIMIHEWWGLNRHIKNQADILAKEGYVVLAVDLYHGKIATNMTQAMELSSSVRKNPSLATENLQSAVRYIKSLGMVNASRVASLGWCFGGDWSLQLALNSKDNPLAATIIYYGHPVTDNASLSTIKWPLLGIFGEKDQSIPVESVNIFAAALNATGITNEIYIYKGVNHAFANPSGNQYDINYSPKEAIDAWHKTLSFLKEHV